MNPKIHKKNPDMSHRDFITKNTKANPKRRMGRIIMLADIIIVVVIFIYITNISNKSHYYFGKPESILLEPFRYRLAASYLEDLNVFSLHASVELVNPKSKAGIQPGKVLSLILKFNDATFKKQNWTLKQNWQKSGFKLFSTEISNYRIQGLFKEFPDMVIPAKDDSFISFDRDKIKGILLLKLDNKKIIEKKLTFYKRKGN